ncbi:MAG: hypothetical protein EOO19_14705 [Chryseobacterium sp.]|nr:MAG: hypothetical protein EOO19_14705 [Chryseobacterium sp.]
MKEELNLPCLYRVSVDNETNIFSFTTKNGIEYKVAFIDNLFLFKGTSVEHLISKVYSLNIEKVSNSIEPLDKGTQNTIETIITLFFKDRENSLMYTCETSDSKEKFRVKKFDKWYAESEIKGEVIKLDANFGNSPTFYNAFLFHAENPFRNQLKTGYDELVATLQK